MQKSPIRVLVIEDSEDFTLFIRRILEKAEGHWISISTADRLSAGLASVANEDPDIVLLDLTLPDSSGLDTFDRVNQAAPDVPIVVMSGVDDENISFDAVQRGAQDYLVKSNISPNTLSRALRYAIERKRSQEQIKSLNAELERRVAERTEELSAANEALARANRELRQFDRMKSAFIDVTSHELRTPVLSIRGMLHVLRRRIPAEDKDLMQAIEAAIRGARRLEGIVARTLEVSRKGEFVRRIVMKPVNPRELIENVAQSVSPIVELRGQTLRQTLEDDPPNFPAAPDLIRDVLLNLVMNAIKFTPDGGHIEVGARPKNGSVLFWVTDDGIGISEVDQPHVFEEFFTTFDTPHHSSGEYGFLKRGIGLGLAIVKNFVELHNGQVTMESVEGKGSTFTFSVPVEKA